jgi:hypothetical protein
MTIKDAKALCVAIVILNGLVGPAVKFGFGYENVHWVLVWPRILLALGAGGLWVSLFLYERRAERAQ